MMGVSLRVALGRVLRALACDRVCRRVMIDGRAALCKRAWGRARNSRRTCDWVLHHEEEAWSHELWQKRNWRMK
jgi:hypothetical protein